MINRKNFSRGRRIPDWAKRERVSDMAWIVENMHIFWQVVHQQFKMYGRGVIVVDTTTQPTGVGHPFAYYARPEINEFGDPDAQRMVREYDPQTEMVIMLLKPQDRVSVYRVKLIEREMRRYKQ